MITRLFQRASVRLVFGGTFLAGLALGVSGAGCSGGYGVTASTARIAVDLGPANVLGSRQAPLPISLDVPNPYVIRITAKHADGSVDTSFNGYVRITAKPGNVQSVSGDGANGRNVLLKAGMTGDITVAVTGAYGQAHILAEDVGYVPTDPTRVPPPQCSDGIDNDGDGTIDFPADPGCAYPNDDTETGGSYSAGASATIFYNLPRISDVRGVSQGGVGTSFPHEQVEIDTGWRDGSPGSFLFNTVVTRVASDGFYATDTNDLAGRGYASVFAYNFSTPPKMRVCDRLMVYAGTASDFYGFTEINYPTWALEEWDQTKRPCLVPEPYVFAPSDLAVQQVLLNYTAGLVRTLTDKTIEVHISKHLGPEFPPQTTPVAPATIAFLPGDNATNCDLNGDGKVDYTKDPEKACAAACTADVECTEYSNFASRSAFKLIVVDTASNNTGTVQADGSSASQFDAVALRGKVIKSFTGTLRYFSGGSQFTIEARCDDDIIVDPTGVPLPSDKACVFPRTILDNNLGSQ